MTDVFRPLKSAIRETAALTPILRNKYFQWQFLRGTLTCKGIYPSFAEAMRESPGEKLAGYDHQEITDVCKTRLDQLNDADYPLLFWLRPLLAEASTLFDLGGNLGVAYYAYRLYLEIPPELRWTVCEVSETVRAGQKLAAEKGAGQLAFTDRREEAENCDIYLSCGALQYIEEPFAEIIGRLRAKPPHIFINRVPLTEGEGFITLQNSGAWTAPYQVANRERFTESIRALGYELTDSWKINRTLEVLMSPQHKTDFYHGMYFRKIGD